MSIRISITGDLGSGKSTVCQELNKTYGLRAFSTGTIQRRIAEEKGMSTFELNKYAETHPEIDDQIDGELKALSGSDFDLVIDSRMAWHFVENTFKVYLITDEAVSARRIFADKRGPSEKYTNTEHALEHLRARKISENLRYREKYGVDCYDMSNYDYVLDTTELTIEETAVLIMQEYAKWTQQH